MLKIDKFGRDILYIVDSKSLAKSIDAYCSFFGISKKEFHEKSGISSGTLSQWRKGTYEPDKKSILKLIHYTNLSVKDLLSGNFSKIVTEENNSNLLEDKKNTATNGDGVAAHFLAALKLSVTLPLHRLVLSNVADL